MAEQIDALIHKGYQFAFISGAKAEDLLQMISSRLQGEHHVLAATGTKYVKVAGSHPEQILYNHSLLSEEKEQIFHAFGQLRTAFGLQPLTTAEDQLQDRDSQITFSILGRNAPGELKKKYDPRGEKRQQFIHFLRQHLVEEKYELTIGGTTSIDVTRKGLDKEWGIREFAKFHHLPLSEILFLGDKLYPGGNDYPATKVVDCIGVKNPEETLKKLRLL